MAVTGHSGAVSFCLLGPAGGSASAGFPLSSSREAKQPYNLHGALPKHCACNMALLAMRLGMTAANDYGLDMDQDGTRRPLPVVQDRVRDVIQQEYATAVKRFEQPGFVKHSWLFTEVYIKTYTHYAFESYQRETV